MLETAKGIISGLLFSIILYLTSFFGVIYIIGPALPFLFINGGFFRKYADFAAHTWLMLPGALMELFCGTKIFIKGDKVPRDESALIIMNHRCRLDWMFYFMVLLRTGRLDHEKIILRDDLKLVPGPGWAMQSCMFLFLKRRWEQDKDYLIAIFNYFLDTEYPLQLLIFPEGTNYCKEGKAKSDAYAKKNNLPIYEYVLHPRVRGFNFIIQRLRDKTLKAVHDVTIGYKDRFCYGELDLFSGKFPGEIHVYITRYDIEAIPRDSDSIDDWCVKRWSEKEERLEKFYKEGDFFEHNSISESDRIDTELMATRKMQAAVLFWMAFLFCVAYGISQFFLMRWFGIFVTVFYFVVLYKFGGIDMLQIQLHEENKKKK